MSKCIIVFKRTNLMQFPWISLAINANPLKIPRRTPEGKGK